MKSKSLLVLACLLSVPTFAQSLPDEINYPPYESRFRSLGQQAEESQSQLNRSRSELEKTQAYISEMRSYIAKLEGQIQASQRQIEDNQRAIPELERQIYNARSEQSRLGDEIRRLQSDESNVYNRYQHELRTLRPLEDMVARKALRLREVEADLAQSVRFEKEAYGRLENATRDLQNLERSIDSEKQKERQLRADLANVEKRIAEVTASIAQQETQLNNQRQELSQGVAELAQLNSKHEQAKAELAKARTAGANAETIRALEQKVQQTGNRIKTQQVKNQKMEAAVVASQRIIAQNRSKIEEIRRDQQKLPARIAESEARQRQLEGDRRGHVSNVQRYQTEHAKARSAVEARQNIHRTAVADFRQDEAQMLRQREIVENLARRLDGIKAQIAELSNRHQSLDRQVAQLDRSRIELQNEIPRLQSSIRQYQSDIVKGLADQREAEAQESALYQSISSQETKLAQLESSRDAAQAQMDQRLSLYNRYLSEAQGLGSSQSAAAEEKGLQEGLRLAKLLSRQYGQSVGTELGLAEAKHWAHVRGEVRGYETGYAEGLASVDDQTRGRVEGERQGRSDAHLYAQSNFKPVFFEELVIEEFKRPMNPVKMLSEMPLKFMKVSKTFSGRETVDPLTRSEIESSQRLATVLDEKINNFAKELSVVEAKARRLGTVDVAFEAPAKIPFGAPSCSQVYKGLAVFKAACESSYRSDFSELFLSATRSAFSSDYVSLFETEKGDAELKEREARYQGQFNEAFKVTEAMGLKIGKEDIYKKTFSIAYGSAYESELPEARTKAKADARIELTSFLNARPLLTLSETKLVAENFRGGEEVALQGMVKNVSKVAFNGGAIIKLGRLENAQAVLAEAVLREAQPLTHTKLPDLKVRVLPTAKAGDRIVIRGTIELPGDLYKTQRVEKFELVQVLAANPAHGLDLNYNKTPSVKGIFRRNIHFLSAKLSPSIEDIKDGYKVTLEAVGPDSSEVELRENAFSTGSLARGEEKELRFSYLFTDNARGKTITLNLKVEYLGKVLKTETIELLPH